jgi:hypothetical protein
MEHVKAILHVYLRFIMSTKIIIFVVVLLLLNIDCYN